MNQSHLRSDDEVHFTKLFSHFLDDNNGGEYYANIISYTLSVSASIACPVIRPLCSWKRKTPSTTTVWCKPGWPKNS